VCFLCRFLAAIDVDGVLSVYDLVSNIAAHNGDVCSVGTPVLVCVVMHNYVHLFTSVDDNRLLFVLY